MSLARACALAMLVAGSAGAAPFRVYQFAIHGSPLSVKSCPECPGGSSAACHPRRVESVPFADYARDRWVPPRGVRLLGSECIADAADLLLGRSGVAVAAVRFSDDPPRQALLDLSPKQPPSAQGWPAPPSRRQNGGALKPAPRGDASQLRLAVVCWPAGDGWPVPSDRTQPDGLPRLEPRNPCEWWLLPFRRGAGGEPEPDLMARSYLVTPNSREEWRGRFSARREWPQVFTDPGSSIEDALEAGWDVAPQATDAELQASAGALARRDAAAGGASAPNAQRAAPRATPAPPARAAVPAASQGVCPPDISTTHQSVFSRFAAWAERFGVTEGREPVWRPSRWQGRCGAYEVLRSALEERLGCRLDLEPCARQDEAGEPR